MNEDVFFLMYVPLGLRKLTYSVFQIGAAEKRLEVVKDFSGGFNLLGNFLIFRKLASSSTLLPKIYLIKTLYANDYIKRGQLIKLFNAKRFIPTNIENVPSTTHICLSSSLI